MSQTEDSGFRAKRVIRPYRQTINAKPSAVHTLICPVQEAKWLDGWDYTLLYSQSGYAEEGCVFISRHAGEQDTIWVITKRDDDRFETQFVRITPGSRAAQVDIRINEAGGDRSYVDITYTITALNEKGNAFIDSFSEQNFAKDMKFWEATMNHYLETGQPLPLPNQEKWLDYTSQSD